MKGLNDGKYVGGIPNFSGSHHKVDLGIESYAFLKVTQPTALPQMLYQNDQYIPYTTLRQR